MIMDEMRKLADLLEEMVDEMCFIKSEFESDGLPGVFDDTDALVLRAGEIINHIRGIR